MKKSQAREETNTAERTIVDEVIQLAIPPEQGKSKARDGAGELVCILDGSIENLGREVVCGYITTYRYGIAAGSLDFVHDRLGLLFVEARFVSTMYGRHQHHSFTCKSGGGPLLANDDLCAFLGEKESRTATDSLCERDHVLDRRWDGQKMAQTVPAQRLTRVGHDGAPGQSEYVPVIMATSPFKRPRL